MNIKLAQFIQRSYIMGSSTAMKVAQNNQELTSLSRPSAVRPVPNDPRVLLRQMDYTAPEASMWNKRIVDAATNEGNAILSKEMGTPIRLPVPSAQPESSAAAQQPAQGAAPVAAQSIMDTPFNIGGALGATAAIGGGYALYKYLQKRKLEQQLREQAAMEEYRKNMSFGDKALEFVGSIDPATIQAAVGAYKAISGNGEGGGYYA